MVRAVVGTKEQTATTAPMDNRSIPQFSGAPVDVNNAGDVYIPPSLNVRITQASPDQPARPSVRGADAEFDRLRRAQGAIERAKALERKAAELEALRVVDPYMEGERKRLCGRGREYTKACDERMTPQLNARQEAENGARQRAAELRREARDLDRANDLSTSGKRGLREAVDTAYDPARARSRRDETRTEEPRRDSRRERPAREERTRARER